MSEVEVTWCCRFHPIDWWHELGCPHLEWTKEELFNALIQSKKNYEDLVKRFYEKDNSNI